MFILKKSWDDEIENPSFSEVQETLLHFQVNKEDFVILENEPHFIQTAEKNGNFLVEFWVDGEMKANKMASSIDMVIFYFDSFFKNPKDFSLAQQMQS